MAQEISNISCIFTQYEKLTSVGHMFDRKPQTNRLESNKKATATD